MAVCVARTPCARLEGEEACSLPKSQDHSGHRLGRDPLRRRGRHHHLLLPLLLLLPLPPAPAAAEPVRRCVRPCVRAGRGGVPSEGPEVRRCGWQQQAPLDTHLPARHPGSQSAGTRVKPGYADVPAPCAVCRARARLSGNPRARPGARATWGVLRVQNRVPAHRPSPGGCGNGDPVWGSV